MASKMILGSEAQAFGRKEKWDLLSPFLREHGREALSYATLQEGMEYFIDEMGYIAFTSVNHPVFARKTKRIVLSVPVCAQKDYLQIIRNFRALNPRSVFAVISEHCAEVLRTLGFRANCIGFEPEIPIQTYNTKGNWKELDLIKRARNEVKREGIVIREDNIETLNKHDLASISAKWIGPKKVNDREIWIYARRPIFEQEDDVRKFVACDKGGQVVGFVFYDPMYREGKVVGYSANISRCDEQRFGKLATAINMVAVEKFRAEGKEVLNLCLAPFVKLEAGKFNDDLAAKIFFKLSERYGNEIYNFKGLSFHKSKYRVPEKYLYFASNSLMPANDVYLAFLSSDITRSYFSTVGRLLRAICAAAIKRKPNRLATKQVKTAPGEKEEL